MEYLPNVAFAMLLGVILGLERRRKHKTAGVRTMMVICGASALITCIGVEISRRIPGVDPTRIAASLLQSIAFIGAGVILTRGIATQGVTTAATILFAVGVGETCGFGMYGLAFAGTLLMILGLVITGRLFTGSSEQCHPLTLICRAGHQEAILARFGPNYELHGFKKHDGDLIEFCIHPQINVARYEELVKQLMDDQNVVKVHAESDGH
ncbi:MAG: MgtC/SapB family protein [Candidatus Obscuribacterales bacterium]|jgi:uncharacterized membrane protein YhiD involved in acid resistance|nr:MgtC/SapB family protein [Candidatus Obscuribacterales bacterium]